MAHHSAVLAAVFALALAAPAAAQTQGPRFMQSIGGGAQWAYPMTGDTGLDGTPGLTGSWRGWFTPHLGLEAEVGWWTKGQNFEYHEPGFDASASARMHAWSAGANVLGGIPIGRATIVLGGGPAWYHENGSFEAIYNGERQADSLAANHFGLHSLAELEVHASSRLAIYGAVHAEWRDVKEGIVDSGVVYPTVGLRVRF